MAAEALPDVLDIARIWASLIEKYTSTVDMSDTVVRALEALTKAPFLKGRLPTTPADGALTLHHASVSCACASAACACATAA